MTHHISIISFLILCTSILTVGSIDLKATEQTQDKETHPSYHNKKHEHINVVILGDSNTELGGDSCNNPKGWNKWFKEEFAPASCFSYARSGATWTNTRSTKRNIEEHIGTLGDDNVVYNQVNRLIDAYKKKQQVEPQLIIISAGTNDTWFLDKRPNALDATASNAFQNQSGFITKREANTVLSLAESVRYNCEMLMQSFPGAQIVLLSPLQSTKVDMSRLRKAANIIEECGQYMSINVIRQDYGCSVYRVREMVGKHNTYDGTHTSEAGAKLCGKYVAHRINEILQM